MLESASFQTPVAADKFYSAKEVAGKEMISGEECFRLNMTRKNDGPTDVFFLSVESSLPKKVISTVKTAFGPVEVESTFSDYQVVDGIKNAMKMDQKIGNLGITQRIVFNKITYNQEVQTSVFDIPESIKSLAAEQ